MLQNTKQYDLEERTLEYGKRIIRMAKALPRNNINFKLIDQVVRSGTSVGANYREAKETVYWLELISEANTPMETKIIPLKTEARELVQICASIIQKRKTI